MQNPDIEIFNEFQATTNWFAAAPQQPAEPVLLLDQVCFYLGMQLEELTEKLELLDIMGPSFIEELKAQATAFKRKDPQALASVDRAIHANPEKWVDADYDNIWVTLGAVRALGIDPRLGYAKVSRANWNKRWPDGEFHLDHNGKVVKPEGWREPDHTSEVAHLKL